MRLEYAVAVGISCYSAHASTNPQNKPATPTVGGPDVSGLKESKFENVKHGAGSADSSMHGMIGHHSHGAIGPHVASVGVPPPSVTALFRTPFTVSVVKPVSGPPAPATAPQRLPRGLTNPDWKSANRCYQNVVLQSLLRIQRVRDALDSAAAAGGAVLTQVRGIRNALYDAKGTGAVDGTQFATVLAQSFTEMEGKVMVPIYPLNGMADASELLLSLLGRIPEIGALFEFTLRYSRGDAAKDEPMTFFPFPLPRDGDMVDLNDYWQNFNQNHQIYPHEVEQFDAKFSTYPEILAIQSGRVGEDGGVSFRNTTPVRLSLFIQVGTHKYHLRSIIHHHGSSAAGGHFTCTFFNEEDRKWYHANDENVQLMPHGPESVSSDVSLLIYERITHHTNQ